jgi:hypothetical protein
LDKGAGLRDAHGEIDASLWLAPIDVIFVRLLGGPQDGNAMTPTALRLGGGAVLPFAWGSGPQ